MMAFGEMLVGALIVGAGGYIALRWFAFLTLAIGRGRTDG